MGSEPAAQKGDGLGIVEWALVLFFLYGLFWALPAELWSFIPARLRYTAVYSVAYQIPTSSIQVTDQPSDCDWGHAPLGDKGCSYKKQLLIVRNKNGKVMGVSVSWQKSAK